MNNRDLHSTIKQLQTITKYGMSFICLLMTLHCGLLYFGYDAYFIHVTFPTFIMLIELKLSSIFRLCWTHKIAVIYSTLVIACMIMRRNGVFTTMGWNIQAARYTMFILGIIVCTLNIWKATNKNC